MPASNQIAHKAEVNNQSPVMWGVRAADSGNDNNKKVAILSHANDLSLTIQISETAPASRGVLLPYIRMRGALFDCEPLLLLGPSRSYDV